MASFPLYHGGVTGLPRRLHRGLGIITAIHAPTRRIASATGGAIQRGEFTPAGGLETGVLSVPGREVRFMIHSCRSSRRGLRIDPPAK